MQVATRYFDKTGKDYERAWTWCEGHGEPFLPADCLPETGIVVEIEQVPVCAGFIYKTDSKICMFKFTVSDPKAAKKERNIGLSTLIDAVHEWAAINEYILIHTSTNIPRFRKRLTDKGFIEASKGYSNLFKKV